MNELLLEPLKYYEKIGKAQHQETTEAYFEKLLRESCVDREENRATVKAYQKEMTAVDAVGKKLRKYKFLRVLCIIAAVLGGILAIYGLLSLGNDATMGAILIGVGALLLIGGILITVKKLKHLIKDTDAILEKHRARANELMEQAISQMAPLNALFSDRDTFRLIEQTIPEFSFDVNYTKEHEDLISPDGVHLLQDGYALLADAIVKAVKELL